MNKVWVPDTYFSNERRAAIHSVTTTNKLMHIYRDGTIVYSMRYDEFLINIHENAELVILAFIVMFIKGCCFQKLLLV